MDRFDWIELEQVPESPARPPVRTKELKDAGSYFRAAENMYAAGHFRAATELYRRAAGLDVRHYAAWVCLIDTLVRARKLDEADTLSQDMLERYRQVRVLYSARALVLAHQGKLGEAWPFCEIGLEGDASDWYGQYVKGELLILSQAPDIRDAIEAIELAADQTKRTWRPFFLGGWALLEAKKPVWAAGLLGEAARWHPRAPICWLCLGDAFHALRLYDQAEFYYQCAAELDPDNELVLARLKRTVPLLYGLTRVFRRDSLRKRWKAEFERYQSQDLDVEEDDW